MVRLAIGKCRRNYFTISVARSYATVSRAIEPPLNFAVKLRRFLLVISTTPHEQLTLFSERPPFVGKSC